MTNTPDEMPDNVTDRPLVTFAILAYNQEKFIREAVEGAFAQTYEPLEIILSDDCSSDRTYEIMQEMIAAYEGPHELRLRRSEVNNGTLAHFFNVVSKTQGTHLVVAAGDDISYPERTLKSIEEMARKNLDALSGVGEKISSEISRRMSPNTENLGFRRESALNNLCLQRIHGATACYRRATLPENSDNIPYILLEDTFLEMWYGLTNGNVGFSNNTFIKYRIHEKNTGTGYKEKVKKKHEIYLLEASLCRQKKLYAEVLVYFLQTIKRNYPDKHPDYRNTILEKIQYLSCRSKFYELNFLQRIKLLKLAKKHESFSGLLIRIFGLNAYSYSKKIKILVSLRHELKKKS
jgi:glycosyltransferase involved in cell wall biosynthesis